jgi:hypothetical protein
MDVSVVWRLLTFPFIAEFFPRNRNPSVWVKLTFVSGLPASGTTPP